MMLKEEASKQAGNSTLLGMNNRKLMDIGDARGRRNQTSMGLSGPQKARLKSNLHMKF